MSDKQCPSMTGVDLYEYITYDGSSKEPLRAKYLNGAKTCVCQNRETQYGSPEDNFGRIARLWNVYLSNMPTNHCINSEDVAIMMALMKIARIQGGSFGEDSWIDAIGYLACGAEIAETAVLNNKNMEG